MNIDSSIKRSVIPDLALCLLALVITLMPVLTHYFQHFVMAVRASQCARKRAALLKNVQNMVQ